VVEKPGVVKRLRGEAQTLNPVVSPEIPNVGKGLCFGEGSKQQNEERNGRVLHSAPGSQTASSNRHSRLIYTVPGHTHGGQIALPLYGALITFSKYVKRYEAGLYREGETWLYVNRGIGMEGGPVPRVRFWARPEVTVIEISPET
jgi:predicted MPP superfamily phosphohydrolase